MKNTALLVVDVQNDVMAESVDSDAIVAKVRGLVEAARAASVPVIWVQHSDAGLARDSDGWRIVAQLTPGADEPIIHKTWGDAFVETDLVAVLSERGIGRIVLCGAQTDACIRSTFYGGIHRGFDVALVEDAHTTGDMREFGLAYGPGEAIRVLNAQAAWTKQPDASGSTTTAAEAFVAVSE